MDARVVLRSLDIRLKVADLYAGVELPTDQPTSTS